MAKMRRKVFKKKINYILKGKGRDNGEGTPRVPKP